MVLDYGKVEWETIELLCYDIMRTMNGDFIEQNITYKGFKDKKTT
jgi:hypothetical protein